MIGTRAIYGPSWILVSSGVDMPGGQDQMNFTVCCRGTLYCWIWYQYVSKSENGSSLWSYQAGSWVLGVREPASTPSSCQVPLFRCQLSGGTGDTALRLCDRTQHMFFKATFPSAVVPRSFVSLKAWSTIMLSESSSVCGSTNSHK